MSDEKFEGWMTVYPVINIRMKNQDYAYQNVVQPKYLPTHVVSFTKEEWDEFKEEKTQKQNFHLQIDCVMSMDSTY